jgi:hypothetical protein
MALGFRTGKRMQPFRTWRSTSISSDAEAGEKRGDPCLRQRSEMSSELRDDLRRGPEYEQSERESAQHERTPSGVPDRIPEDHSQQPQNQPEEAECDRKGDYPSDDRGKNVEHPLSVGQPRLARASYRSRIVTLTGVSPNSRALNRGRGAAVSRVGGSVTRSPFSLGRTARPS